MTQAGANTKTTRKQYRSTQKARGTTRNTHKQKDTMRSQQTTNENISYTNKNKTRRTQTEAKINTKGKQ